MERKPTNDYFESFLHQSAEDFRIKPSPKVWENISKDLNKKRRRFFFAFATLALLSSVVGYITLNPIATRDLTALDKVQTNNQLLSKALTTEKAKAKDVTVASANKPVDYSSNQSQQVIKKVSKASPKLITASTVQNIDKLVSNTEVQDQQVKEKEIEPVNGISLRKALSTLDMLNKQRIDSAQNIQLAYDITKQALKKAGKPSRLGFMVFFTPTISYRKLSENKSYLRSTSTSLTAPGVSALYDINNAVTHKPDIGLEFGMTSKYNLTRNVKLRAGVQFNISRYDIKAFNYVPEVATIALNMRRRVDSVNTVSNYRNFSGSGNTDWLQNFYFQLSTPIGAEVKVYGNDKTYLGIASTIQPTYVLGDRAYLITADYKNYAQVPWLMRRWNVNTNLETFMAYSTGKLKWQVGPQVRYQLLSSFITEYPVKENLFDFGLKVGVSLNQKDQSK